MRTDVLKPALMLLALLVTSGSEARFVDEPTRTNFAGLEPHKTTSHAPVGIEPVVAQVTDPLSAEGKEIDLQVAAAKDWSDMYKAEDAFAKWYGNVSQERLKRNDPGYLRQREESIAGELARTKKIIFERDAKICRLAGNIEDEIGFIQAPVVQKHVFIAVAWNKQFAPSVLKDIALELKNAGNGKEKSVESFQQRTLSTTLLSRLSFVQHPMIKPVWWRTT
jgi:hypothetical protein